MYLSIRVKVFISCFNVTKVRPLLNDNFSLVLTGPTLFKLSQSFLIWWGNITHLSLSAPKLQWDSPEVDWDTRCGPEARKKCFPEEVIDYIRAQSWADIKTSCCLHISRDRSRLGPGHGGEQHWRFSSVLENVACCTTERAWNKSLVVDQYKIKIFLLKIALED